MSTDAYSSVRRAGTLGWSDVAGMCIVEENELEIHIYVLLKCGKKRFVCSMMYRTRCNQSQMCGCEHGVDVSSPRGRYVLEGSKTRWWSSSTHMHGTHILKAAKISA